MSAEEIENVSSYDLQIGMLIVIDRFLKCDELRKSKC